MLVLTRKPGEKILIGDDVVLTVLDTRGEGVRLGIEAPASTTIRRSEIVEAVVQANREAAQADRSVEESFRSLLGGAAGSGEP